LPVVDLDLYFWKPGRVAPSESEWRDKQRVMLAGHAWIADGNYRETLDLRLERADTLVVLDMPRWRCAGRGLLRGFRRVMIHCSPSGRGFVAATSLDGPAVTIARGG
jgi:adenylate kinase family enzyme